MQVKLQGLSPVPLSAVQIFRALSIGRSLDGLRGLAAPALDTTPRTCLPEVELQSLASFTCLSEIAIHDAKGAEYFPPPAVAPARGLLSGPECYSFGSTRVGSDFSRSPSLSLSLSLCLCASV